jgi:hypothetical protein
VINYTGYLNEVTEALIKITGSVYQSAFSLHQTPGAMGYLKGQL